MKAKKAKEIVVNTINELGILSEITQVLLNEKIDIRALSCRVEGVNGVVHLITDDNALAVKLLKDRNFEPFELDAALIEMPNKPGMLKKMAAALQGHKINIGYLYATALAGDDRCLVVASTSDVEKTIEVISKAK